METGKAIYSLLKDSADVGAICADRIYPELAQQDVDVPFIVYTVTDTTPSGTKNATSKLDTARVELFCVSNDYEESMDLGIAVRGALDRQSGTIGGVEVQSIDFDTSDIQYDPDQRVYVLEQTYDVRIQRTGTAQVVSQFPGNTFTVEEADGSPTGAVNKLVFSNGTVTLDGYTATITTGAAEENYHGRYDTEAESERSGATGTVEYYYTARPDGDGEAESETSDTGVTDTINRTLAYSTKFRADPDTAADWTDYTTQPADNASFATAKAALLAGLNETDATAETRGTLPLSLKMTRTTTEPVVNLLLDDYPGAAAAYSVRKLSKDYTGDCMRVRRSSDDTTQDIGFDSNGDLDTAAIATFVGDAYGYCAGWYDQSGNGNDALQSTAGSQPMIYDRIAAAVVTDNGKPALKWDGSDDYLETSSYDDWTDGEAMFSIVLSDPGTNKTIWDIELGVLRYSTATGPTQQFFLPYPSQDIVREYSIPSGQYLVTCYFDGSENAIYNDGVEMATTSTTNTIGDQNVTAIIGSRLGTGSYSSMYCQELIHYPSDQTASRSAIETDINDYYSIY